MLQQAPMNVDRDTHMNNQELAVIRATFEAEEDRLYELERLVRAWRDARNKFEELDTDNDFQDLISASQALKDFADREIKP